MNKSLSSLMILSALVVLSGCKKNAKSFEDFSSNAPKKVTKFREQEKIIQALHKEGLTKETRSMDKEEAIKAKKHYESLHRWDMAIKVLERLVKITTDHQELGTYLVELADAYARIGKFEEAEKRYALFCKEFPGSEKRKYASYQLILTKFWRILSAEHDQTYTQDTITLAKAFMEDYAQQANEEDHYIKSVQETLKVCYSTLLEREKNTLQFYLDRYNHHQTPSSLNAAEQRLAYIQSEILPELTHYSPELNDLEVQLAQALQHTKEVHDQVHDNDPEKTSLAQKARLIQAEALAGAIQEIETAMNGGKPLRLSARDRF